MSLSDRVEELEDLVEDLRTELVKIQKEQFTKPLRQYYTISEGDNENYHTSLVDSNGHSILYVDTINELQYGDIGVGQGVRLYNTELYEWEMQQSLDGFELVLKRK